jgi:hypothetical protein
MNSRRLTGRPLKQGGLTLPCCGLHCASRHILAADVRFGSEADITAHPSNVCFASKSERQNCPGSFDVVALAAWRLPRSRAMHCMVSNRTFKSYGGASFGVVPRASWHAPCVMASLTGLLHRDSGGDTESYHDKDSQ